MLSIFAEESVLEKAGVILDPETGKLQAKQPDATANLSDEERRRLSAFSDFVNSLDLDDFDKKNR